MKSKQLRLVFYPITHRFHVWYILPTFGCFLLVNVGKYYQIYHIHGFYGIICRVSETSKTVVGLGISEASTVWQLRWFVGFRMKHLIYKYGKRLYFLPYCTDTSRNGLTHPPQHIINVSRKLIFIYIYICYIQVIYYTHIINIFYPSLNPPAQPSPFVQITKSPVVLLPLWPPQVSSAHLAVPPPHDLATAVLSASRGPALVIRCFSCGLPGSGMQRSLDIWIQTWNWELVTYMNMNISILLRFFGSMDVCKPAKWSKWDVSTTNPIGCRKGSGFLGERKTTNKKSHVNLNNASHHSC